MRSITTIILILSGCGSLVAQGFYNNGAVVSITAGTVLSVPDSIVNKGTLINNGEIIIQGAWINTGTYDAGAGQITFDSDLDQVINHNAQSIERLVISGGGKKEFNADIFVQSSIKLEDGILVSKNGARIVMDAGVDISGGSDASHIQGPVERKGVGDWVFPIGNGSQYLPVVIPSVTNATAFGIVTLHELGNGQTLKGDYTLSKVSSKRYWELVSGGDALNSTVITLPIVDEDDLATDTKNLTIASSNTATEAYTDLKVSNAQGSPSLGQITSTGHPTQKYYAVAGLELDHTISVYNAVSAGSDGKNDFMTIENIEFYPDNTVAIFNRWGDRVFETSGYDNNQNVFRGISSNGNKLPSGTYYYSIDPGDGGKKQTGYVVVR